jgi:hypothetical protein
MPKGIYFTVACMVAGAAATVAVAQTRQRLPPNCYYDEDGRVHCVYLPPS